MTKIPFKAVAVDMDGTFENDKKEFDHQRFEKILTDLRRHHVHFIVSSGRPLSRLRQDFYDFLDRIDIVADNGSILTQDNKIISRHVFTYRTGIKLINFIETNYPEINIAASGLERAYVNKKAPIQFKNLMHFFYPNAIDIGDLRDIPTSDSLTKLTLKCSSELANELERKFNQNNPERIHCTTSGFDNIDVMPSNVNKGQGIKYFLRYFAINPEELIAFGDGMNDQEMIELAGYSYAMENADERLKKIAKYEAPSNNEMGVLQVLESYLKQAD
ncbi:MULTISPECIES: Cof-type HAD-IIB family hydrolase [unclassified Lactobacillus]|uniref:Cof-type HAD-IIB family hydrolase n=1 Tax=unclassified Lactobacillus TaxID=2620435 RepID=UPI000EFCED22|nr:MULTISPECIES: Cof-type HAD-IIB family hydrolase [unclassified Lactobacillus]RMC25020.1 HAD family hydrolase [Lactobacillus sp. ESL0247]RMC29175.1 HAD family hydrolase [Lactobacillus sp. ESL0246]RMC32778.1 HAD family hydrolase [Lactobacillus sp. ESL0245]RMC49718.1 HAD family hydrolase [Lactobacillus sp. ESL0228]